MIKAKKATAITKPTAEITDTGAPPSVEQLITTAIVNKVPVATMERLLAMRDKIKAEQAKEAFDNDLAGFQGECPPITKDKEVRDKSGKLRYSYAPLEVIVSQIKTILEKRGFSYSTNAIVEEGWVTAVCKVTHKLGHSETSSFKVPIDKDAYMSGPQKFASALTFAKRYAFCNAFGILTADEDNDAQTADSTLSRASTGETVVVEPEEVTLRQLDKIKHQLAALKIHSFQEFESKMGDRIPCPVEKMNTKQASQLIASLDKKIKSQSTDQIDPPAPEETSQVQEPITLKDENGKQFIATEEFKTDVSAKMLELGFTDIERGRLFVKATGKPFTPNNDLDWMKLDSYLDMVAGDPKLLEEIKA